MIKSFLASLGTIVFLSLSALPVEANTLHHECQLTRPATLPGINGQVTKVRVTENSRRYDFELVVANRAQVQRIRIKEMGMTKSGETFFEAFKIGLGNLGTREATLMRYFDAENSKMEISFYAMYAGHRHLFDSVRYTTDGIDYKTLRCVRGSVY
jgi:hypothetical protein